VLPVLPTMLAALVLWPLASPDDLERPSLWPAGLVFIVGGVLAAFLHLTSPWTPRHPDAAEPVFVIDPAGHAAWRVSQQPLDAWTRGVLTAEGGRLGARGFTFSPDPIAAAPAAYQAASEPDVKATAGPGNAVTIVATPHAGAGRLVLALSSAAQIDGVSVNGQPAFDHPRGSAPKPYGVKPGAFGAVIWTSAQPLTLTLHTANLPSRKIGVTEIYDRWMSAKPLPPTPPREQMWNNAGSTYVVGTAGS
jgi:hypothetical protein